jgi:NAD(P)-dependent dehydrogenase (short-subunit alcohol dehydrogenase family)
VGPELTATGVARAVVTGGATGMGFATARRLLDRGASVLICGRRGDALADARAQLLEMTGRKCELFAADLAEPEAPAGVVEACLERFGGIEVLFNNAGIAEYCEFEEMTLESWERSQDVMVRAPMLAIQAALPWMKDAGFGRVINNASISASLSEPGSAQYSAAKAALVSLTKTAAIELAPFGVRANAIAPGWVRTPMGEAFLASTSPEALLRINPLGRAAEPDEIARVVEFLALDAPDFLTGETIYVDGGQAAYIALP